MSVRSALRHGIVVVGATVLASAFFVATPAQADAAGNRWGTIINNAGSKLQACKTREDGGYGPTWKVTVRANNQNGNRPIIGRIQIVRDGDTVVHSWRQRANAGETSAVGHRYASILKNDEVRAHVRRPNGTGTLTTTFEPTQLPACGSSAGTRNWGTAVQNNGSRGQACQLLTTGGYGPVYKTWYRGNNVNGDATRIFGAQTVRDDASDVVPGQRWEATLDPGEISPVGVLYASQLKGDGLSVGIGELDGRGLGYVAEPRLFNIC